MTRQYLIVSVSNPSEYWSNVDGWVDRESADVFIEAERASLTLPIGGQWEPMQ